MENFKRCILIVACTFLLGCGVGGSTTSEATTKPPACIPESYSSNRCSGEGFIGDYVLRSFGLEQVSTGYMIRDETDYEPWSGTMTIDEWEMVRRISKTPDSASEFTRTGYLFQTDGNFYGLGSNASYLIDGMFIILMPTMGQYSIGNTNWGWCFEYEYWEKVSD